MVIRQIFGPDTDSYKGKDGGVCVWGGGGDICLQKEGVERKNSRR